MGRNRTYEELKQVVEDLNKESTERRLVPKAIIHTRLMERTLDDKNQAAYLGKSLIFNFSILQQAMINEDDRREEAFAELLL